jgi:plastocyanin
MKTIFKLRSVLIICLLTLSSGIPHATKWTVEVSNYVFTPSSLTDVKIGDTIHWQWMNGSHTTTSTSVPSGAASWDQPINSSSQTFEYTVTVAGTYDYKCTPHASMGMTGSFIATQSSMSVPEKFTGQFRIYPNPSTGLFRLELYNESGRINRLTVSDLTGKTIIDRNSLNEYPVLIDLQSESNGYYFAKIQTDRGFVVRKLIISK